MAVHNAQMSLQLKKKKKIMEKRAKNKKHKILMNLLTTWIMWH